jgi:hypothetical protein
LLLSDWDFTPRIDAAVLSPEVPAGLGKIPFQAIFGAK